MIKDLIKTTVTTTLSWRATELHGTSVTGVKVDEELKYNVLLKDIKGYCFESEKTVKVKMSGPFLSTDLTNNTISDLNTLFT